MNTGSPAQSPASQGPPGHVSNSPSLASNHSTIENTAVYDPDAPKYFFQEKYAPLNVKGNFLTLCACPKNVELGEWLAHQSKYLATPPSGARFNILSFTIQSLNNTVYFMACSKSFKK